MRPKLHVPVALKWSIEFFSDIVQLLMNSVPFNAMVSAPLASLTTTAPAVKANHR